MKATETKFLPFLQGTKQFIIPIYQRTYSWTLAQCQQLWDDIRRVSADEHASGHFVGSIVYIDKGLYQISSVPQLLVIDGQQRLTTLSLLLAALGKAIEERGAKLDVTRKKINNYYLLNSDEDDELRYKLLLTQSDKDTLIGTVEDAPAAAVAANRIVENYAFFLSQLRKVDTDLAQIYQGIGKLIIVDISLDRERDNPQLIFESLNSTGLKLSQADLIRNYVLMGLENKEQSALYSQYWFPMEQSFGHVEYAAQFDRFMRDYLTIKTGRIPNISDVYTVFKAFVQSQQASIRDIVADIYQFSRYFVRLAFHRDPDPDINQCFIDINTLRVDVAYPFLLEVYDDYEHHLLDRASFLTILKLVESYVFRRVICGIPTNSLNKTFATFSKEVQKESYLESVQVAFLRKDSYRRFPGDEEVQRELKVKDVYNFRTRNYLLRKLENAERPDSISIDGYMIEHIMPTNERISPIWREELGPDWQTIQSTYGHTIGNLTLVSYSDEQSQLSFREKRDVAGGFADTPLLLNRDLAQRERWDAAAIQQRAEALAAMAVQVWHYPSVSEEARQRYSQRRSESGATLTLEAHAEFLQGPMLDLFEQLRRRILNLDSSVREDIKKYYIAYKTDTNFVDVEPQRSRLRLTLNMAFDEIEDPKGICKNITNIGRWGNGDVEVVVATPADIEEAMPLIQQSFIRYYDDGNE
ncbi:MAG: DUF262 domain-containing protein [Chloroflexales bacterium]|nr:DUF262 domain-containing protein [Chloroflexales bacterium]